MALTPLPASITAATKEQAFTEISNNISTVNQQITERLTQVSERRDSLLTVIPKSMATVTEATAENEQVFANTRRSLGPDIDETLNYLSDRVDPEYGEHPFSKVDTPLSQNEIDEFNAHVTELADATGSKNKAVEKLLSTAVETTLQSSSLQFQQLTTFKRVIEFIDNKLNNPELNHLEPSDPELNFPENLKKETETTTELLSSWEGNTKYSHYISSNPEGQRPVKTDSPLHAIQTVLGRVNADMENGGILQPSTARDMSALLTIMAALFSSDVKANAIEQGLSTRADPVFAQYRPGVNMNTAKHLTNQGGRDYRQVAGNSDNGNYPATFFGPSMSARRTMLFIMGTLGGTREEQGVYAMTQGSDWDVNSKGNGKYRLDLFHWNGSHSIFEALMTKADAAGVEVDFNQTQAILMRSIIRDMNIHIEGDSVAMTPKEVSKAVREAVETNVEETNTLEAKELEDAI